MFNATGYQSQQPVRLHGSSNQRAKGYSKRSRPLKPFMANHAGTCRGCGMKYQVGDDIVVPAKGYGGYHPRCYKLAVAPLMPKKSVDLHTAVERRQSRDTSERMIVKTIRSAEAKEA